MLGSYRYASEQYAGMAGVSLILFGHAATLVTRNDTQERFAGISSVPDEVLNFRQLV